MIKAEKLQKPIKNIFYLFCYFKNVSSSVRIVILQKAECVDTRYMQNIPPNLSRFIIRIYYTIILRIMITNKNNTKEHTTFSSQIYYDATNYITSIILFNLFFLYLC